MPEPEFGDCYLFSIDSLENIIVADWGRHEIKIFRKEVETTHYQRRNAVWILEYLLCLWCSNKQEEQNYCSTIEQGVMSPSFLKNQFI